VVAHFFYTATTYVAGAPGADLAAIESLCRTELLPERLVGDRELMERWRQASPAFFGGASSTVELAVLSWEGEASLEPEAQAVTSSTSSFRLATQDDRCLLEEYERLSSLESGDEMVSDFESLIAQGLVLVSETSGRVAGMIRSNLSDGRYVHAGGLYVPPANRGRGIGRGLALELARHIKQTSGDITLLDCDLNNESALRAYRLAGYKTVGGGLEVRFPEDVWR
jgi:ribosomal protein S18 acetylase RimI-like enzyme